MEDTAFCGPSGRAKLPLVQIQPELWWEGRTGNCFLAPVARSGKWLLNLTSGYNLPPGSWLAQHQMLLSLLLLITGAGGSSPLPVCPAFVVFNLYFWLTSEFLLLLKTWFQMHLSSKVRRKCCWSWACGLMFFSYTLIDQKNSHLLSPCCQAMTIWDLQMCSHSGQGLVFPVHCQYWPVITAGLWNMVSK